MLEKEMFLKNSWFNSVFFKKKYFLLSIFLSIISFFSYADDNKNKERIAFYFENINEFSSKFIQIQNNDISEGYLYIKDKRLRIDYISPSNLIFILKKNKGMFYNPELSEVQYFNTHNSSGEIFFDLFNNKEFIFDSKIISEKLGLSLKKNIIIEDIEHTVKIFFEDSPLELRKIELDNKNDITSFSIMTHNYNPDLNSDFFSLANPLLTK